MNRMEEAKKYYEQTVNFGEESESQESGYYLYALLHLGKIAAYQNKDDLAKDYLKQVKKYAKRKHPAHREARKFLKENKL